MNIFQKAEFKVSFSLSLLNAVQNAVFTLGTLLVCYLNAYQISVDMQDVAKFVTLLTYLAQLQAPLNFFGTFYTMVQNNLVDAERMLELVSFVCKNSNRQNTNVASSMKPPQSQTRREQWR